MYLSSPPQNKVLSPYVHSYHEFGSQQLLSLNTSNKLIPDGFIEIWFQFGALIQISINGKLYKVPRSFTWGQTEKYSILTTNGINRIFAIRLYPWVARLIFNLPSVELSNHFINLEDLNIPSFNYLQDKLIEAGSFEQRRIIVEEYLIHRIKTGYQFNDIVIYAFNKIYEYKGSVQINQLAKNLGYSRQYINRIFKEEIGLSPKKLATIIKIRACIDQECVQPSKSLTQLGYQFDFFDQSHFIRDFKAITGEVPKTFFKQQHLICWHMNDC